MAYRERFERSPTLHEVDVTRAFRQPTNTNMPEGYRVVSFKLYSDIDSLGRVDFASSEMNGGNVGPELVILLADGDDILTGYPTRKPTEEPSRRPSLSPIDSPTIDPTYRYDDSFRLTLPLFHDLIIITHYSSHFSLLPLNQTNNAFSYRKSQNKDYHISPNMRQI